MVCRTEKVEIQEVFDYAGERVSITRKVDATSKEARDHLLRRRSGLDAVIAAISQKKRLSTMSKVRPENNLVSSFLIIISPLRSINFFLVPIISSSYSPSPPMDPIQSKLDWDRWKEKEGIAEDLEGAIKAKGGYLEKQAFLARADRREFEVGREERVRRIMNRK